MARIIETDNSFSVLLLALKDIKTVHESARELELLANHVKQSYVLQGKIVNTCTDRCAMNQKGFRGTITPTALLRGEIWMPCVCHILNNVLSRFFDRIPEFIKPIFRLQQFFRKNGPFLSFLAQRRAPIQSIPSYSVVRWYSSQSLFKALLVSWDNMVAFAEQENLVIAQLTSAVRENIRHLSYLTARFAAAQRALERDGVGTGSGFIGALLSIQYLVHKYAERQALTVQELSAL
jgi:hypothetical protein